MGFLDRNVEFVVGRRGKHERVRGVGVDERWYGGYVLPNRDKPAQQFRLTAFRGFDNGGYLLSFQAQDPEVPAHVAHVCFTRFRIQLARPSVLAVEFKGAAANIFQEHVAGSGQRLVGDSHHILQHQDTGRMFHDRCKRRILRDAIVLSHCQPFQDYERHVGALHPERRLGGGELNGNGADASAETDDPSDVAANVDRVREPVIARWQIHRGLTRIDGRLNGCRVVSQIIRYSPIDVTFTQFSRFPSLNCGVSSIGRFSDVCAGDVTRPELLFDVNSV